MYMKIAADFSRREVKHSATMLWADSPMPGVARRPLDRVGSEVARATTVVRTHRVVIFQHMHMQVEKNL